MSFRFNQGDRPLPGYTIQRGVGRGGFGEVYYALSDGGKEVALKYLRENPQVELRGATHCLNLKSPYLIALHDIKQNPGGEHFVVMEFVHGVSLRDLMIDSAQGLGPEKAAYFVREIAKGLAYLHDRGIVHRDLKPGNIFYEDGYVKIGDYGLSKIMAASQHSGQTISVGTVHYMAPEVGAGNYDRTIDIYALGVILYELLLGRVPYSGSSMGEVLMKHLTAQPEVSGLGAPFADVIRKALAKDPKDRYQNVNEMIADLFVVEDLNRSVTALEPASISTMAARAARNLAGPVQHGGVAVIGAGSSNAGQMHSPPPPPIPGAGGRQGRFAGMQRRLQHMSDRLDQSAPGGGVAALAAGENAEAIGKAFLIAVTAALAVTIIRDRDFGYGLAVFAHIVAILQAAAIWHWRHHRKGRPKEDWSAGFTFAVLAGGLLFLANLLMVETGALGDGARDWLLPCLLSFVFCDWRQRLDDGRHGVVSLGSAISMAIFAFIAVKILPGDDIIPVIGILAAASLGVQTLGGRWPLPKRAKKTAAKQHQMDETMAANDIASASEFADGAVAISRDGLARRAGHWTAAGHDGPMSRTPIPVLRNPATRAIWFGVSALVFTAMVLCFASLGLMNLPDDDYGIALVSGVVLSHWLLFALSCALPRYQKGLWRGIFRKATLFLGTSLVAGAGTSIGIFNLTDEDMFAALVFILLGGAAAVVIWFIPVSRPDVVKPKEPIVEDEKARKRAVKARTLKLAGLVFWGIAILCVPIILGAASENDWDEYLPATLIPLGVMGALLITAGAFVARIPESTREDADSALPVRRNVRVESVTYLRRLLDRHAFLSGYKLDREGEMMWKFVRGDWNAQFWQSDVRRWKTELTVAAYEDGQGEYRVTAQLDVDAGFNKPDPSMIRRLNTEMDELQSFLESGSAPGGKEVVVQTRA
ncbi:MAG TPA: serine/threonine-protein kinase [Phycisphaerae bacterium]|nr:serine/threonine-protein kinase [Phycisphaerae bacterium]